MLLKEYFESAKFVVTLTRNGDYGLYGNESSGFKKRDLEKRAKIINDAHADIFISVHLNKYAHPSRRGAQVFYKLDSDDSKKYANAVQFQLNNLKESMRLYDVLPGDFYLLNTSSVKNAILVECGFLSNPEEERLLQTETYREKVAKAIFNGTLKYLLNL
jgi:N-acetylmuramoyl-L-alanine amidase